MGRVRVKQLKTVLVTAGPVYGKLDDNKIVSNRSRGIWAASLACELVNRGHRVLFLMPKVGMARPKEFAQLRNPDLLEVILHDGFGEYQSFCVELASEVDAAVLAAAVVNWIPKTPFNGKMPTKGVGDEMQVTFKLAPRVIDKMKRDNKQLTLIGCKMTSGETHEHLIELADQTLRGAHCTAVVANDLDDLKKKYLVFPDATEHEYELKALDDSFIRELVRIIEDRYYKTEIAHFINPGEPPNVLLDPSNYISESDTPKGFSGLDHAEMVFNCVAEKYRSRFKPRPDEPDKVFGSVAVRVGNYNTFLVSPREKFRNFTAKDAVKVYKLDADTLRIYTDTGKKATLNAPLLIRMLQAHPEAQAVLHLHDEIPSVVTEPYAPPGTVRDNNRELTPKQTAFNIDGHGFVAILDENLEPQEM